MEMIQINERISMPTGKLFFKKKEEMILPVQIQFFEEYMIIQRNKTCIKGKIVTEYNKIFYLDIEEFATDLEEDWIVISGMVNKTLFAYQKDGNIATTPMYEKRIDDSCFITPIHSDDKKYIIEKIIDHTGQKLNKC